ncbi:hypothetical protein [Anaeromassilibacillus sp. SJQ-1]|uniref:hypothetical protein n=1 Tax=Anaeromassilibacillus sp. SJQ-1 TaxID=3375419 RepID=UPI003989E2D2
MKTKTLTIQLNDEQLPILPAEPVAHLTFTIHDSSNELELTGNQPGCSCWRKPFWVWRKPFVRMDSTSIWTT